MTIGTMLDSWRPASLLDFDVAVPVRTDDATDSDCAGFAAGAAFAATGSAVIATAETPRIQDLIISHSLMYQPKRLPLLQRFGVVTVPAVDSALPGNP